MLYMILGHDAPDALDKRLKARPEHLQYLQALQDEGRLILAGPRPKADAQEGAAAGFYGSLIVAEFKALDDARNWAEADPYAKAGVFERVDIHPFVKVFPA